MPIEFEPGKSRTEESEDALGMLMACHARMRRFVQMSRELAKAEGADPDEVARGARMLHRYFSEALPLHAQDEDVSIAPRLRDVVDEGVLRAIEAMEVEHRQVDSLLVDLVPLLDTLAEQPERLEDRRALLKELTSLLGDTLLHHISAEEAVVFPAMEEALSQQQLDEIVTEMRARRTG
ncbi:MAG: hemerythrin domain-containing protein [Myxococcota bacterium]